MKSTSVITLTTDLGDVDYYVGALKGDLLSGVPNPTIIDITHKIDSFNITQAAFVIKNAAFHFPEGSIHIIGVSPEIDIDLKSNEGVYPMVMQYKKHYFLSADNGFFSLLTNGEPHDSIHRIESFMNPESVKDPLMHTIIPAAISLAQGKTPDDLGSQVDNYKVVMPLAPILSSNLIKGSVAHIDKYGNVITNISSQDFLKVGKNQPFTIFFRRKEYYINKISSYYGDVSPGEKLALFNSSGFLEIAINKGTNDTRGGANALFGLQFQDTIRIEFYPPGSKETIESLF